MANYKLSAITTKSDSLDFMSILNAGRKVLGLNALNADPYLIKSAYLHSKDMAENSYFSHTSLDGRTFDKRMIDAGYLNWIWLSENIAYAGSPLSDADLYSMWRNSPVHYANMMDWLTDAGLGVFDNGVLTYATLDLACRGERLPRTVTLSIAMH